MGWTYYHHIYINLIQQCFHVKKEVNEINLIVKYLYIIHPLTATYSYATLTLFYAVIILLILTFGFFIFIRIHPKTKPQLFLQFSFHYQIATPD